MTSRSLLRWVLLLVSAVLLSCSDPTRERRGELMLVLVTDMQPPKDFDQVTVEVSSFGSVQFSHEYSVGEAALTFPATLGIVAGKDPTMPVTIRVSSSLEHKPRTLREVVTPIPSDRVAALTIPIEWLCVGQVQTEEDGSVVSTCDNGKSCVAGACESTAIDPGALPDYDASAIFGGGDGTGTGSCFDTLECFASGAAAEVDLDSCSISGLSPVEIDEVSLALVLEPEAEGICGPEVCLVPLDRGGSSGWAEREGALALPALVCQRLASGAALGVAATTVCDQKTASLPTCGSWSNIDQQGTLVAETPPGPWQGGAGTSTGGSETGTGGADTGTGGADASTGGADTSTGGANPGAAGTDAGAAGTGTGTAGAAGSAGQDAAGALLAYYRFDEEASAQLYADATGHGYDLTRGETTETSTGGSSTGGASSGGAYSGGAYSGGSSSGGSSTGGSGPLDSHDPAVSTTRVNGQGYAAEFDGTDDYAWRAISGPFLSGALTVSASVRNAGATSADQVLVSTETSCPGGGYALSVRELSYTDLGYEQPGLPVYVFSYRYGSECSTHEVTWHDSGPSSYDGGWRSVTATYEEVSVSEARVRLFIDGAQVAENTFPELMDTTGVSELLVGTHRALLDDPSSYDYDFFYGTLDELQIYDRALGPEEVAAAYQQAHYSSGPSGYQWRAIDGKGSQTSWLAAPSSESATVEVSYSASGSGGLAARLSAPGELVDLSAYDEAVIDADVPAGALFAISLERGDARCVWARQVGQGSALYVIDLGAPSYCVTPDCSFDFRVDQVSVSTDSSEAGVLDMTVRGLSFRTTDTGDVRGPVGGTRGLASNLCLQLATFGETATAQWQSTPSSESAQAMLGGGVGTEAYVQVDARDMETYNSFVRVGASLDSGVPFRVRVDDAYGASCYWDSVGQDTPSYEFYEEEATACEGGGLDSRNIATIWVGKGPDDDPLMVTITSLNL